MTRYPGPYHPERRSRSPRDRSPYGGDRDRGPPQQYPDNDRRRPIDARGNPSGFPSGRDGFRGEPPRGPKALIDAPNGPRGGFSGDFRGRGGRGGGRGRPWRDDSRDAGRDDHRDRPHYREDRSREREHPRDREWPPRDQRENNFFRGRRSPPPMSRGRSPPSRDFMRDRDVPLNVDADRARRGSRDGPLSAGSSNSDQPFGGPFRGGPYRGGRGGGRGRGDWDRGGGRGRGYYENDRPDHRFPRSHSQDGRYGREPDIRDHREPRYQESARDIRDDRPMGPRDREHDLIRSKPIDRVSNDPPSAKDVSPPPLAPSAPAFGTVPSRPPATTDIQSITGKPPPTGPRALAVEERPPSAGQGVSIDRAPPTGPSKIHGEASPTIPSGPRAHRDAKQPQRSSKQWINPAFNAKKPQESPKSARSMSVASQHPRPFGGFRPESFHAEFHSEYDKRPRSPDAKSDSHTERYGGFRGTGVNDIAIAYQRGSHSARASLDRDMRLSLDDGDLKMGGAEPAVERAQTEQQPDPVKEQTPSPAMSKAEELVEDKTEKVAEQPTVARQEPRPLNFDVPASGIKLPEKQLPASAEETEESDEDDEDLNDYFSQQVSKAEAELKKLLDTLNRAPIHIAARYTNAENDAMVKVVDSPVTLQSVVKPIPEDFTFPPTKPQNVDQVEQGAAVPQAEMQDEEMTDATHELPADPRVEKTDEVAEEQLPGPQPKVEDMDVEGSALPSVPAIQDASRHDEDVDMDDASEVRETVEPLHPPVLVNGELGENGAHAPFRQAGLDRNTPSHMDDDSEDRTEDDGSIYGSVENIREFSATPPTEDLPFYHVKPWEQSRRAFRTEENCPEFGNFLLGNIQRETATAEAAQSELRRQYAEDYWSYLKFTQSDDPVAVKSRAYFSNEVPVKEGKGSHSDSKPEGRGTRGRFATEYDLKKAMEQSEREFAERQEREERSQKEKYRSDKEAVIPDMLWTDTQKEQASFYDTAGKLPLEKLVATWDVVPWHVNFTKEEAEKFEKAYLEFPKQWGKIAKELPNRDTGTCIQYYYAMKRELSLKEKLKKQPKKRKKGGRAKQRSSALVSELGNGEHEAEDAAQETGENGERRRPPRRAAAPNFGGNEATPNADSDGATPAATPARRRGATTTEGAKNDSGAEKTEGKRARGRKQVKDKAGQEAKGPKLAPSTQTPVPLPLPVPGTKGGRSRANSKAQGPEWASPQAPVDIAARPPGHFEAPPGGMQPPLAPVQQPPPLSSPEGAMGPMQSTISEVMAAPSLRPEPPLPQTSVPTFEISQPGGPDRTRTPQQASSYWSVSESNDFPGLLRAFGTDWNAIAAHMQTKTATMVRPTPTLPSFRHIDPQSSSFSLLPPPPTPSPCPSTATNHPELQVKNFYMRQTKEGGRKEANVDWELIANEADAKYRRGEKRPAPPTPTQGPRKRYDVPSGHRPLAAAEPEEHTPTKIEPMPAGNHFSRFQVPIAQAAPVSHPLAQPTQPVMSAPLTSSAAVQQQAPPNGSVVTQAMSPHIHPLRPPAPTFTFQQQEREPEPTPPPALSQHPHPHPQQPQPQPPQQSQMPRQTPQPVPISQKPPVSAAPTAPVTDAVPPPAGWPSSSTFPLLGQVKDNRDSRHAAERERQAMGLGQREPSRQAERAPPLRMKQDPDQPSHTPEAYPAYQPPRTAPPRSETIPLARQPEPPHRATPAATMYGSALQGQPMRGLLNDPVPTQQPPSVVPGGERPLATMQRPTAASMQEQFAPIPASAPPVPPPQPAAPAAPRPPEPRKTSNIMSLLNDEPPPPPAPKRVADVSMGVKPSSTPPPQSMGARQQPPPTTSAPAPPRREEAGYPYARNPPPSHQGPPSSAIPPLKPSYHAQSPRPPHSRVPSSTMVPTMDPAMEASRAEYYPRHFAQHQSSATNSPQAHTAHHYGQTPAQHPQHSQQIAQHQHAQQQPPQPPQSQQHPQQAQMAYQPQGYQGYAVSQAHAPSPTPQYAPHPGMAVRREPQQPAGRESWSQPTQVPTSQQQQMLQQEQQERQRQQMLQQQQHVHGHQIPQQPPQQHQPPSNWPPSQQGTPQKPSQPVPTHTAWGVQHGVQSKPPVTSSVPSQQQHAWTPTGPPQQPSQPFSMGNRSGPPVYAHETQSPTAGMVHHQHQGSIGSGRYQAPQDARRGEPAPPNQPFPRYTTPGPGQARDAGSRSYTPVNTFDARGPPPQAYGQPDPMREAHMMREREAQYAREREMARDPREMGRDPREMARDPREMGRDPRELGRDPREMAREQAQAQHQAQVQGQGPPRGPVQGQAMTQAQAQLQAQQRILRPQEGYDRPPPRREGY
ncbi:hypothetical protein QBC36DRAFT_72111 [Triangularia setosa]|uniref:SANT domain-containing protein n=1 Tax=Triangularia setosa TaxID=2587417 RepID=A0AAN7A4Y5_9PEZI|nr:hypothetical protein QBC36DRAFT_72111 [Podospora setosa]